MTKYMHYLEMFAKHKFNTEFCWHKEKLYNDTEEYLKSVCIVDNGIKWNAAFYHR